MIIKVSTGQVGERVGVRLHRPTETTEIRICVQGVEQRADGTQEITLDVDAMTHPYGHQALQMSRLERFQDSDDKPKRAKMIPPDLATLRLPR